MASQLEIFDLNLNDNFTIFVETLEIWFSVNSTKSDAKFAKRLGTYSLAYSSGLPSNENDDDESIAIKGKCDEGDQHESKSDDPL